VPAVPGRLARVSLGRPVINAARLVIFLVTGAEKRASLRRVLSGDRHLPGALVQPRAGRVEIFADRSACPACD
jgi:6-phosphogluconolactonase